MRKGTDQRLRAVDVVRLSDGRVDYSLAARWLRTLRAGGTVCASVRVMLEYMEKELEREVPKVVATILGFEPITGGAYEVTDVVVGIGSYVRRDGYIYFNQGGINYRTESDRLTYFGRTLIFGEKTFDNIAGDAEPKGEVCDRTLPPRTFEREGGYIYIQGRDCYKVKDEGQRVIVGIGGTDVTVTLYDADGSFAVC